MRQTLIPLIAVFLFFLEPVFSLFSPIALGGELYTLVPRFVIVYLIFLAIYDNKRRAIIYGIVLGLLYDLFYIDIIGVYAFLYPLICYIATILIRQVPRHILTVMLLTLVMIALLETLSYGFASLIALTTITLNEFMTSRLVPTMMANAVFVVMFDWLMKKMIDNKIFGLRNEIF